MFKISLSRSTILEIITSLAVGEISQVGETQHIAFQPIIKVVMIGTIVIQEAVHTDDGGRSVKALPSIHFQYYL